MAIFQPTNIIPSSFTQGTVDVNQNMEISWQVNGNSAMTAFQIDFYLNDTASTFVWSTGRKTDNCPFYGTDCFGRPQFFTYNANEPWNEINSGFTNGNNYKFKITQWYEGANEVSSVTYTTLTSLLHDKIYYFKPKSGGVVYFSPVKDIINMSTAKFYYSFTQSIGWYVLNNIYSSLNTVFSTSADIIESDWIELGLSNNNQQLGELFLMQNSFATFITRDKPTLSINRSTSNQYNDSVNFPDSDGNFSRSIGYFKANYQQEQGDPIRWIRWQVATATYNTETEKWLLGDILADTGDIYTPTLNFEFNGFFNGGQYAIRCLGESESSQSCNSGWTYFNIDYTENTYTGNFTAQCLHKENATLLEWERAEVIDGTYTKPEGNEEQYNFQNSAVVLPANSSITWNTIGAGNTEESMNFAAPWTSVWKGEVQTISAYTHNIEYNGVELRSYFDYVMSSTFSPNGELLVLGGRNPTSGSALFFNADNNLTLSGGGELKINGNPIPSAIRSTVFSPDGKLLILIESPTANSHTYIFSINNTNTPTYVKTFEQTFVRSIAFSPDGKYMIVCGGFAGRAKLYAVNGTNFTDIGFISKDGSLYYEDVFSVSFYPTNNRIFIFGGNFDTHLSLFRIVTNNGVDSSEWIADIVGENGESVLGSIPVERLNFSPDGTLLVVGGDVNYVSVFSVFEENVEWEYDIKKKGDMAFNQPVLCEAFSDDGKWLVLGGQFKGNISMFMINNGICSYIADPIYAAGNVGSVGTISFSSKNNDVFVIGGYANNLAGTVELPYMLINGTVMDIGNNNISVIAENYSIMISINNISTTIMPPPQTSFATVILSPTGASAYFYANDAMLSKTQIPINYTQNSITSVRISGGNSGATVESVSVFNNAGSNTNILDLYDDPNFEPIWNASSYQLYMTANFNGNIQGGTGNAEGNGFQVYRREVGGSVLTPIANVNALTTSLKDYGIRSRKAYEYLLGVYDSNSAFMGLVTAQNTIATCFKNYSLMVCDYDETNDEYHVRKQYLFALNLSTGSVGNNNSPTLNANFTRYPTRMPSTQNYASGTLQGLIGAIYTVPALIEQIGNYKWTAKPSTLDYFDSVDLEKELYDLSTAPYQLFLRDMKGHLRMVATSGAISMTTNIKQKQQSISISFPWVEIGDATDVTIIQTSDDYGWNNDNQVLDVQLDVDTATGELSATYPFPYNGTKFYLTGVNKENLTAKTPIEVTPAQFNLSDTATQTTDGEVTATVTVNSEVNK